MKNTPKNIHKWWSMQDQLDQEDKEKEEAEQKKLDAQRQEAERIYWEEKKKREELELLMIDEVRVECGSEG